MRSIRWIGLFVIVLGMACQHANEKVKKTDIIPKENLVPILVEIHLADALLQMSVVRENYPGRDSISNYQDILKKYGYTKERFDRTIEFYENDPEELNDLYEEVVNELSQLQSGIIQRTRQVTPDELISDLWNQKTVWHLPDDGRINRIGFKIPVKEPGKYTLTATIRMHPDDGSIEPRVSAFFWFDDGTETGFRIPFEPSPISKDGKIRNHTLSLNLQDERVTHITGFLLDHNSRNGNWEKHADVLNIKIQYIELKKPFRNAGPE
jgi:hypothetical protein